MPDVDAPLELELPGGARRRIALEDLLGEQGPQGPQGPAGADGAQGPQGAQGPAGAAGAGGLLLPLNKYALLTGNKTNSFFNPTLNREFVIGFDLAPQTIGTIAVVTGGAPPANATIRLGIRANSDGAPGAPAAESLLPITAGLTWYPWNANYAHPGGVLWVSLVAQTASPQISQSTYEALPYPLVSAWHRTTLDFHFGAGTGPGYQDGVSGALPSTFTNAMNSNNSLPVAMMSLRRTA